MDEDPDRTVRNARRRGRDAGRSASGMLVLSDEERYVGDEVTFKGRNFPAAAEFDLVWHSVDGSWAVLKAEEVVGPQYRPRTDTIATVTTDESGSFDHEWTIPQDYGGSHTVEVRPTDGEEAVAEAELTVDPWFDLDRTSAPMGETFRVTGYGLGPNVVQNNYQLTWDNGFVGVVTGVQNRGTATADLRAVGPPGEHLLQVWRNYRGVPQVQNETQSPYGSVGGDRAAAWTVEVTEPDGEPRRAWVDELFDEEPVATHYPELDEESDAELEISPTSGQAGSAAVITGRNFPAETPVDLIWYSHDGSYVQGIPMSHRPRPGVLPTVRTDADGAFEREVTIPTAAGSTRPIVAMVEGRSVAATGFVVQPSIERFEPREGPVGTDIEIDLGGLGWTSYENSYFVVYDNRPLGYASGTMGEDPGSVAKAVVKAAGDPGYHFIDIYPGIFEMQEDHPDFELAPHLSYLDNHPVRPMPAIHLVFEVTD